MKVFYVLLVLGSEVFSSPIKLTPIKLTEGDIVLTEFQESKLYSQMSARNGYISLTRRWPNKTVIYKFSPTITANQKFLILNAFEYISSGTCVRFQEATKFDSYYVYITNENSGCWSYVGCISRVQQLNLQSNGCMYHGTIVHEFLHALGFFHQQSAAERDSYIKILYENIYPGAEKNFIKYGSNVVTSFGFPYDYRSIMHYGKYYFTKNSLPTIQSLGSDGYGMGQRDGMTQTDFGKLNKMYNC